MGEQVSTCEFDTADPITYEVVTVSPSDLYTMVYHGSVVAVTGTSEDGTQRITFAGDTRLMCTLLDAVKGSDCEQQARVADYQIQRVLPVLLECGCPTEFVLDNGHQEGCEEWLYS